MAYIDPEGMYGGDRIAMLSDKTRWVWPWLWCLGNSVGRFELNYRTVVERAFRQFKSRPTEEQFWAWIKELHSCWLLFVYESNGQLWGQWNVEAKYLPQYAKRADQQTPAPNAGAFLQWRRQYEDQKKQTAIAKCPIANVSSAISETSKKIPVALVDVDSDVDVDVDVKPSCPAKPDGPAATPPVPRKRRSQDRVAMDWIEAAHERWYWEAYWRRVKKGNSLRAYAKQITKLKASGKNRDEAEAFLFDRAIWDRKRSEASPDWSWRQNLHPATWLNSSMWEDEVAPPMATVTPMPTATDRRRAETIAGLQLIDKIEGRA